jgi:fatty-acyl-CoA synthase
MRQPRAASPAFAEFVELYASRYLEVGDPAWYFFTSGTAGAPKAAVLTHDQLGYVITNHLADLMPTTTEQDRSLVAAPLSHGAGIHLLPQVAGGAASIIPTSSSLYPAEICGLVETEAVSSMFTVPTILKRLAEDPAVDVRDHSSLKYVIYAGAPMAASDQAYARGKLGDVLVQYYGLGEVTGNITVLPPRSHDHPRLAGVEFGTCGYPPATGTSALRGDGRADQDEAATGGVAGEGRARA